MSLQELSQQYISHIRLACDSLSVIFEQLKIQGYKDSPDRTQVTMQELITSQRKLYQVFETASKLFPADLDKTVNAFKQSHASDQDLQHIQFEHK